MRTLLLPVLLALAASSQAAEPSSFPSLPKPGARVPLEGGTCFVYGFAKPPKLGTATLRVEILRADGTRDTSYVVRGDADMPSMRGAHSTGSKPFAVSAKGVYLLPVPLVMPGDWEIRFTFERAGKTILRGAYAFDL